MKDQFVDMMKEIGGDWIEEKITEEELLGKEGMGRLFEKRGEWYFKVNDDCGIEMERLVEMEDVLDYVCGELDIEQII